MLKHATANNIIQVIFCCLLSANLYANVSSPLPRIVKQQWQGFEMIGETRLRHFGFHIYDATFWMLGDKDINNMDNNVCALSITYARNISAQELLSSTEKEWRRLGFADQYPIDAWLKQLTEIWPNVHDGDQLVVVTTPNGSATFYNKESLLGKVDDPKFGSAFLAIWLDENSRFTKNRKELLGE
jgi:hypothetical protein